MGAQDGDARGLRPRAAANDTAVGAPNGTPRAPGQRTALVALAPLRLARAELLRELIEAGALTTLNVGAYARYLWQRIGLTLAQRDAAAYDLAGAGLARLVTSNAGLRLEAPRDGGR